MSIVYLYTMLYTYSPPKRISSDNDNVFFSGASRYNWWSDNVLFEDAQDFIRNTKYVWRGGKGEKNIAATAAALLL